MLKVPYGISNFEALITGGYLYVDKTRYIREIEDLASEVLQKLSRRDFIRFDEKHIKVVLFSLLGLADFYLCHSEQEVEHGFLDLFLSRAPRFPELPFEWLIELKCLKEAERGQLAEVREQARAQLSRYGASREIRSHFRGEAVRQAALVFIGKGDVEILMPPAPPDPPPS